MKIFINTIKKYSKLKNMEQSEIENLIFLILKNSNRTLTLSKIAITLILLPLALLLESEILKLVHYVETLLQIESIFIVFGTKVIGYIILIILWVILTSMFRYGLIYRKLEK